MKYWLVGTVASIALLGACGNKDNKTASTASQAEASELADLPAITLAAGDASEAEAVLTALSLDQSGSGNVSFATRAVENADATFSNVEFALPEGEDGDAGKVLVGTLTLRGMDLVDGAPSFSQMSLEDIMFFPDAEDEADGEGVRIETLQVANPSPALAAWVGSVMGEGEPRDFPDIAELGFDAISMDQLSVNVDEDEGVDDLSISRVDFRDMSPSGLGAMLVEGLNFSVMDDDGRENSLSVGAIDIRGVGEVLFKTFDDELADSPDKALPGLMSLMAENPADPGYDSAQLRDIKADMGGIAFDMAAFATEVSRNAEGLVTRNQTLPFEASLAVDPEGELGADIAGPLALLGYETLVFRGAGDSSFDHGADMMSTAIADNYLELVDGFRVSSGSSLQGLSQVYDTIGQLETNPSEDTDATFMQVLSGISLHGLEIEFVDDSFVDRAFAAAAAMGDDGQTADELKQQARLSLGILPLLASSSGIDPELVTEMTGALDAFLSNPGTLNLSFDPENPITLDVLEDPTQITKSALGFSATAK